MTSINIPILLSLPKIYVVLSLIYFIIFIVGAAVELKAYRDNPKRNSIRIPLYLFALGVMAIIMYLSFSTIAELSVFTDTATPLYQADMSGNAPGFACDFDNLDNLRCVYYSNPNVKVLAIGMGLALSLLAVLLAVFRVKAHTSQATKNSFYLTNALFIFGALALFIPYILISVFNIGDGSVLTGADPSCARDCGNTPRMSVPGSAVNR